MNEYEINSDSDAITESDEKQSSESDKGLNLVSVRDQENNVRFEHGIKRKNARRGTMELEGTIKRKKHRSFNQEIKNLKKERDD